MDINTKKQLPLVVIFGRTNVGKSTLFNCLTEKRRALVSPIEGTTRDSNIGEVEWQGQTLQLIDTGGIIDIKYLTGKKAATGDIEAKVQKQAKDYLTSASLVLFLVDSKDGLLPQDKALAFTVKKLLPDNKKIILVANKVDSAREKREIAEFNKLALGEPISISAANGSGTGDLLDLVLQKIKKNFLLREIYLGERSCNHKKISSTKKSPRSTECSISLAKAEKAEKKVINVAIIGKPNVGKSSLVNALLGEERIIVSPIPHTTREPQDTLIEYNNYQINLIDTAGISKQGQKGAKHKKIKESLEKLSIAASLKTLNRADIALLMVDINEGLTHQEAKLIEEIVAKKVSLIIVANKWDLIKERDTKIYTQEIYGHLPFAKWAPIQFLSATTGEKVHKLIDMIIAVSEARRVVISENGLSKFLGKIVKKHKPAQAKGEKHPYIYTLKQVKSDPPFFALRVRSKDTIHFSYLKFIENRLREKFGFIGTPLTLFIDQKKHTHGSHND